MENKQKNSRKPLIIAAAALIIIALVWFILAEVIPGSHYQRGQQAIADQQYPEAYSAFCEAGAYRDAMLRTKEAMYLLGVQKAEEMDYTYAVAAFGEAGDYLDAAALYQKYNVHLQAAAFAKSFSTVDDTVLFLGEQGQVLAQVCADGTVIDGKDVASASSDWHGLPPYDGFTQDNGSLTPKAQGELWGYVDASGAFVIPPTYEEANAMVDSVALVHLPTRHELVNGNYQEVAGLWQVIDETGETLLRSGQWEPYVADTFRDGWLPVKFSNGELGYINPQGKKFLNRTWDSIDAIYSHYAVAADYYPSTTYVLDMQTESIVGSIKTSEDVTLDKNGFVFERHRQSSSYSLRNFSGTKLLSGIKREPTYTSSMGCPFHVLGSDYLVVGNSSDGYGLYRIGGTLMNRTIRCIVSSQWDYLCGSTAALLMTSPNATGGIFSIGQEKYVTEFGGSTMIYGFVDTNGKLISDVQWWNIHDFNADGIALVCDKRGWGAIDTSGAILIEPQWDHVSPDGFQNGLCAVKNEENLWGYIDQTGAVVIPCQFMQADSFHENGTAIVAIEHMRWLIDKQGQMLVSDFEELYRLENGLMAIKRNDHWQLLNQAYERIF